jgi:hypothetical protein
MNFDKLALKIIETVMADCEKLVNDRQWAIIRVEPNQILIDYGVIHSNGQFERAIGTRAYHISKDGVVGYTLFTHP